MANSVETDETAHNKELSHLDLHCLHMYLYWSAGMKGLTHFRLNRLLSHHNWKSPISILGMSGYLI